jgi:hypothetical protein
MTDTVVLDLDVNGNLLRPGTGETVAARNLDHFLLNRLAVPTDATDIVVFVNGWRTAPERAAHNADRFFTATAEQLARSGGRYPGLRDYRPFHVVVRWPSQSAPSPWGYRRIRNRAHSMSTQGHASAVIAHLLGYLNEHREKPVLGAPRLRTGGGQYLHCVGHSFGGRFLCEAIQWALGAPRAPTLGWTFRLDPEYPYVVDTLLIFQMAARTDAFSTLFPRLLDEAPVNCPIVLTYSSADRATGFWHLLSERTRGVGHRGATEPAGHIATIPLLPQDAAYDASMFSSRIVNVDATWRYERESWVTGAHSGFWHPESFHLFLSLAGLAR